MKQTKKFTRSQRQFLESKGITNFEGLRFCHETKTEFVYYDSKDDKVITLEK